MPSFPLGLLPHLLLLRLIRQIFHHVTAHTRADHQVDQPIRAEVPAPVAQQVPLLAPGHAAQDEATGEDVVPAVHEELLERDEREEGVERQQVEAEQRRGQVGGQEAAHQIGERVVVGGGQAEGHGQRVVVGLVLGGERGARRMQREAVQRVAEALAQHEAAHQVLDDLPRQRQRARNAQRRPHPEPARQRPVDARLHEHGEHDVGRAEERDARQAGAARDARGDGISAVFLELGGKAWEQGVEEEEEVGRQEVEQESNDEGADQLDLGW